MNSEPGSDIGSKKTGRPFDCITLHFTKNHTKPKKNNRYWWTCNYCQTPLVGRDDNLQKHILSMCRRVPEDARLLEMTRIANESRPLPKKLRRLTCGSSAGQDTLSRFVDLGLSADIAQQANKELLRMCVTGGISFRIVENTHFRRLLGLLRPSYVLPGRTTMSTTLLTEEFTRVQLAFRVRLELSGNLTIALGGLSSLPGQSLYAVNVIFPNRTVHVLAVEDLSPEKHTSTHLIDRFKECVDLVGADKVAAIVTDNAAAMKAACAGLTCMEGYEHILGLQCMLHGFALLVVSILSHAWASRVVAQCQRIVTFFRDSNRMRELLSVKAEALQINSGLVSANTTRLTSVQLMLESVAKLRSPLKQVAEEDAADITAPTVSEALNDLAFWGDLELLNALLEPVSAVVTAVQADDATLADMTRYWVYMGQELLKQIPLLPIGFARHIAEAYSWRARQMNSLSGRLALALDPRFKRVALPEGRPVEELAVHMGKLLMLRGASPEVAKRCMHEFIKYSSGFAPYDLAYGGEHFNVMAWWRGVKYAGNAELAVLAEVLYSVVPHSASVERAFSDVGWFQSKRCNRLDPDTIGKLTAIKRALHIEAREASKRHAPSGTVGEEGDGEEGDDQETSMSAEELVAELEALSKRLAPLSEEAADLTAKAPLFQGGEPISFAELLMGNWDGFDMQAQLHPGFVPDACVAEVPGRLLGPAQRYDVAALLQ